MMSKFEEEELWKDLEEMGLLSIETDILPECAVYQGTETRHGVTYEQWKGISGKVYHLIKERS